MGCCFGKSADDYEQLVNTISLHDKIFPSIPDSVTRLRDCSPNHEAQIQRLFSLFDSDGDGFVNLDELETAVRRTGKTPSRKMLDRMMKQMHLSSAPQDSVDYKGFAMAVVSRKSLLFDYLYTDYDTLEEWEQEQQQEKKKKKSWFG